MTLIMVMVLTRKEVIAIEPTAFVVLMGSIIVRDLIVTRISVALSKQSDKFENREKYRKALLGDIRRIAYWRFGPKFHEGDDWALWHLEIMLRVEALHRSHGRDHMERCIDLWAPWLSQEQREIYLCDYTSTDPRYIWPWPEQLRDGLHISTPDREHLRAWRVRPYDKTDEQLAKYNREKRSAKRRLKRWKRGAKSRSNYETYSISKLKPWELENLSRAAWYRKPKSERETSLARVLEVFKAVRSLELNGTSETSPVTDNYKHYGTQTCLTSEVLSHTEGKETA